jgi:hypothetical protein
MSAAVSLPQLPDPHEIVLKAYPDKIIAYACADCGAMYATTMFGGGEGGRIAAHHAAQSHCHHFCTCGTPVVVGRTSCNACWLLRLQEREQEVFEAAKKVTIEEYPDQPVYWDGSLHGMMIGDGYFLNIEEFLDRCEEEGVDLPPYVWATRATTLAMSADFLLEHAMQEHHEGARDTLPTDAETELQEILDEWCSKQKTLTWEADYKMAVLLHPKD